MYISNIVNNIIVYKSITQNRIPNKKFMIRYLSKIYKDMIMSGSTPYDYDIMHEIDYVKHRCIL